MMAQRRPFTSPGGNLLDFSFYAATGSGDIELTVAAFDGTTTIGSVLYTSQSKAVTSGMITISGIDLPTIMGGQHIAFIRSYGALNPTSNTNVDVTDPSSYGGGKGFFSSTPHPNAGTPFAISGRLNLVFSATFSDSSVPEPATWAMFIRGFGLIGAALRRRQCVSVSFA
jgi:hypothetical protein